MTTFICLFNDFENQLESQIKAINQRLSQIMPSIVTYRWHFSIFAASVLIQVKSRTRQQQQSQQIQMFQHFYNQYWQYGIVVIAIVALLGLKALTLRTKYNKQLDQFVHPSIFMEEIKKKVKSPQQAEQILTINLNHQLDHNRLRNISILVTFLNDEK